MSLFKTSRKKTSTTSLDVERGLDERRPRKQRESWLGGERLECGDAITCGLMAGAIDPDDFWDDID